MGEKRQKEIRLAEVRAAMPPDDCQDMVVEGYALVFEQPTVLWTDPDTGKEYKEIISRGALDGVNLSDVPFKYNHLDSMMIMARSRNKTLTLIPDDYGLKVLANLAPTTGGRDLYTLIQRGDISKMSFAFYVADDEFDRSTTTRRINKFAAIGDVSAVDCPAYEQTSISARSYCEGQKAAAELIERERLEAERKLEDVRKKTITRTRLQNCGPEGCFFNALNCEAGLPSGRPWTGRGGFNPVFVPSSIKTKKLLEDQTDMEKRMQEIAARKAEIRTQLQSGTDCDLDAINAELDTLEAEERTIQKRLEIAQKLNVGDVRGRIILPPGAKAAQEDEQRSDIDTTSMEYRTAFMRYVVKGTPMPAEFRADATTTTAGAPIPQNVLNTVIDKLLASGMILPLVTQTNYKGGVAIPNSNVKPVATWVAESAGSAKQAKTTGSIIFGYYKLRCAVAVSLEVDEIAVPAFEAILINNVSQAMVIALEQSIISGTGTGQPTGIISASTTVPAGQVITGAPKRADFIKAEGALDIAYEQNAKWCMTKQTFNAMLAEVDTAGQPIARVNEGIPGKYARTLLGREVVLCNYLPTYATGLTAGTVWAFLFDFSDYVLNTNYSINIQRYQELWVGDDWVTRAVLVADGKPVSTQSLVTLAK